MKNTLPKPAKKLNQAETLQNGSDRYWEPPKKRPINPMVSTKGFFIIL